MTTAPRPARQPLSLRTSARPRSCELLRQVAAREPQAFDTLYHRYAPSLRRFLCRRLPHPTCWTTSATTSAGQVSGPCDADHRQLVATSQGRPGQRGTYRVHRYRGQCRRHGGCCWPGTQGGPRATPGALGRPRDGWRGNVGPMQGPRAYRIKQGRCTRVVHGG